MPGLEARGEFRHRRPLPFGEALVLQHRQVLQWRYAVATLWTDFELLGDGEKKATAICGD